ncbi:MAG: fimbria major subunit, partial [Rikenellaceae bacterium]|nr:fimbria major subunit [Rikenellaceae bacterium]
PLNSPVIRNNIYHINVRSFSALGETWNPLYPEDPNTASPANPDPKPSTDEPDSSIDPYDPLSIEETYMDIDATVLDWIVNSYDIDF